MRRYAITAVLFAAVIGLSGCSAASSSDPATNTVRPSVDPTTAVPARPVAGVAACRKAIKAQYVPGTAQLTGAPTQPPECDGLSSDEVSKIALSVVSGNTR